MRADTLARTDVRAVHVAVLLIFTQLAVGTPVRSDALVVTRAMGATTIAEVYVEESSLRTELEIGLEDLRAFRNLLPDDLYRRLDFGFEPIAERLGNFFQNDWVVRVGDGPPLNGTVLRIESGRRVQRDEITGEPLPAQAEEEELVLSVLLEQPLRDHPTVLQFTPPHTESGAVAANIGFVVYHEGLAINDFRYLGAEETLELDWHDPWYSHFSNRNLRRKYDAPMSAFLYIEPFEVRKEIVVRPKDLGQWLDLGLEDGGVIPASEQAALKQAVADFLAERNPVTIDGIEVEGTLDRIHFIRRTLRRTGIVEPPEDLRLTSATLGVIYVYPTAGLPERVTMTWELFSPRIQTVPTVATDEAGGLPSYVTPDAPVLEWQNFLVNPTVPGFVEVRAPGRRAEGWLWPPIAIGGVGLIYLVAKHGRQLRQGQRPPFRIVATVAALTLMVGVALPRAVGSSRVSDAEADSIVSGLLENVYRAFDYRDESVTYDTLERSVDGELLTKIYLQMRRALEIENQGGARAKVKQIELVETEHRPAQGETGFVTQCTWNVSGSVGHWGHIHQRVNQYQARFTIRPLDGAWKLTELELLEEQRL